MPVDGVPYIGKLTGGSDRILTATGYQKWGMTTSMVAAMLLTDAILGRENPWAALFDATRIDLTRSAKELIVQNADVAKRFVGDRLEMLQAADVSTLAPGEGGIVDAGGTRVAAYRDEHGAIHAVSPRCAHMGCIVSWNTAEKTWDCPCHGSRYTAEGRVIQGPTVADLEPGPVDA
jgi:Rieske Fe-S protein